MELIGKESIKSFNETYEKYYKLMLYIANKKLNGNYYASQDVVQDCLFSISRKDTYKYIEGLDEHRKKSFIAGIVSNKVVDYYRSEKKYILSPNDEVSRIKASNVSAKYYDLWDELVIKLELMDIIEYMNELSLKERRIFKLLLLYDMKLKDISRACNISIDAVKKRLIRARIKLRGRRLLWEG